MQNHTPVYEAPSAIVVELGTEGLICESSLMTMFLLDSPADTEVNFGRDSYGSAATDTWN